MIDLSVRTQPQAAASRPYHQKIAVTVTAKPFQEAKTDDRPGRDLAIPKVPTTKTTHFAANSRIPPDEYKESFARMMVNLSAERPADRFANSGDHQDSKPDTFVTSSQVDDVQTKGFAEGASNNPPPLGISSNQKMGRSATDDFMDYMNQTDAEKLRQELTGVTKEEYDKMSSEEKLAVDEKLQQLLKKKQEITQLELKAKIAVAKSLDSQLL